MMKGARCQRGSSMQEREGTTAARRGVGILTRIFGTYPSERGHEAEILIAGRHLGGIKQRLPLQPALFIPLPSPSAPSPSPSPSPSSPAAGLIELHLSEGVLLEVELGEGGVAQRHVAKESFQIVEARRADARVVFE
ncbi:unnamed protein product [Closterium sp. NIES-53]